MPLNKETKPKIFILMKIFNLKSQYFLQKEQFTK